MLETFDAVVVGGGPVGATAASELHGGAHGTAAGPRRPDQAVRRGNSAATDPGLCHSRPSAWCAY